MDRLTLIRHAITDWNTSGRFQGHTDRPLSDDGRTQACRLARRVRRLEPAVVYSSTLRRARETAEIAFPGRSLCLDERLRELHFGDFEGSTQAQNEAHEAWAWWYEDPFARTPPGGESYGQLRERAVAWLRDASAEHGGHVVAVTHSGTIQMLLSHFIGVEHPRWRKRFYLRHTSLTLVLFRDGEALVERVNDHRHLRDETDPFLD